MFQKLAANASDDNNSLGVQTMPIFYQITELHRRIPTCVHSLVNQEHKYPTQVYKKDQLLHHQLASL
jgi:hypothetical protein